LYLFYRFLLLSSSHICHWHLPHRQTHTDHYPEVGFPDWLIRPDIFLIITDFTESVDTVKPEHPQFITNTVLITITSIITILMDSSKDNYKLLYFRKTKTMFFSRPFLVTCWVNCSDQNHWGEFFKFISWLSKKSKWQY